MRLDDLLLQLFTLGIFHVTGGIALGWGLRQVAARHWSSKLPYWLGLGIGFGLLPLALGASTFLASPASYLFFVELVILAMAIGIPAFAPTEYLMVFASPALTLTVLGAFAILSGIGAIAVNAKRDLQDGLVAGGLLILIGIGLGGLALARTFGKR